MPSFSHYKQWNDDFQRIFQNQNFCSDLSNKALISKFELGTPKHLHKFPRLQVAFHPESCLYNILKDDVFEVTVVTHDHEEIYWNDFFCFFKEYLLELSAVLVYKCSRISGATLFRRLYYNILLLLYSCRMLWEIL